MRQSVLYLAFLSFLLLASRSLAEEDLFAGTPSPTPAFLSDHSYDNSDIDGTAMNKQKNGDPDKKDSSVEVDGDQNSSSRSKETDINGL